MGFFKNAQGVTIYGGRSQEIHGDNTTYNNSVHNVNSGNATNHITTDSNNDSSRRTGRTRNNYSRTHTAPAYSASVNVENGSQENRQASNDTAQDRYAEVQRRAHQSAASVRRAMKTNVLYDPYSIHSQQFEPNVEAVDESWQSSQPQKSSWQMPTAQPQQPYARTHSDPFPAPMVPPQALPPSSKFKSNNPFRRMTDMPASTSFPEWPQPVVSTDAMEDVEGKERKERDRYPYE